MPKHRAKVLEDKKLLVFKEMPESIGHVDEELVGDISAGFRITGKLTKSGIFDDMDPGEDFAPIGTDWLWREARQIRANIAESARDRAASGETSVDQELWDVTMKEVEVGSLEGPLGESSLDDILGKRWIANRRFAVEQGDKIRPIDDFSESLRRTHQIISP